MKTSLANQLAAETRRAFVPKLVAQIYQTHPFMLLKDWWEEPLYCVNFGVFKGTVESTGKDDPMHMKNPTVYIRGSPDGSYTWLSTFIEDSTLGIDHTLDLMFYNDIRDWEEVLQDAHQKGLIILLGINDHGSALRVKFMLTELAHAVVALIPEE